MEEIEKAIAVMQQHKCEEIALYGDEYNLALEVLREKQEQKKQIMNCPYCGKNHCWNCKRAGTCQIWDHCETTNYSDYEADQNYCQICGRKLVNSDAG